MSETLILYIINSLILIATIAAIYFSPIKAVKVGRQLNDEQRNDTTKRNLFLRLFSYRGSANHWQFVEALNQIDVVFHGVPPVLISWHKYYDSLQIGDEIETDAHRERWKFLRTELLSEMATHLGFGSLKQIDMMKYYYSKGQQYQDNSDFDLKEAGLTFLKSGAAVYALMIENYENQSTVKEEIKPDSP